MVLVEDAHEQRALGFREAEPCGRRGRDARGLGDEFYSCFMIRRSSSVRSSTARAPAARRFETFRERRRRAGRSPRASSFAREDDRGRTVDVSRELHRARSRGRGGRGRRRGRGGVARGRRPHRERARVLPRGRRRRRRRREDADAAGAVVASLHRRHELLRDAAHARAATRIGSRRRRRARVCRRGQGARAPRLGVRLKLGI